eukprot:9480383-Pyramimonas_sp.AAC.1
MLLHPPIRRGQLADRAEVLVMALDPVPSLRIDTPCTAAPSADLASSISCVELPPPSELHHRRPSELPPPPLAPGDGGDAGAGCLRALEETREADHRHVLYEEALPRRQHVDVLISASRRRRDVLDNLINFIRTFRSNFAAG